VTAWNNLKIATKLSLGFGVILAIIATIAVISFLNRIHYQRETEQQVQYHEYRETFLKTRADHYNWLTAVAVATFQDNLAASSVYTDNTACPFSQWLASDSRANFEKTFPAQKPLLEKLEQSHTAVHATFSSMRLGAEQAAGTTGSVRSAFQGSLLPQSETFSTQLEDLRKAVEERLDTSIRSVDSSMEKMRFLFMGLFAITLVTGVVLSVAIVRSVVPPLQTLVQVSDKIAAGELRRWEASLDRSDEIGDLYRSFKRMHSRLVEMAQTLQSISEGHLDVHPTPESSDDVIGTALDLMVKNLRDLTGRIANGATSLAAASAETSASAAQLSASTAESASAISETTATMEEVRQTASMMNNNAASVAENARQGGQMAQQSRERVKDISEAIRLISSRMDFIAQHTVELSEKNQKIGEIISVVNDIADQSNILAVNASIEAAKAGEEGKGFAVLAEEIRNLAEQSKQATREIKIILDDIQKATSATVMATEEGSKAVAKGEQQTETVGKVILELASSVSNSSRSADTIASSAREQLKGIEQVTLAMESIRTASQQNKDSARQLEETSASMKNLGQELMQLVQRFKR